MVVTCKKRNEQHTHDRSNHLPPESRTPMEGVGQAKTPLYVLSTPPDSYTPNSTHTVHPVVA